MEIQKIIPLTISVDFDGTCVTHEYPRVGRDIGAVPVLKDLVAAGHRLILFTMRGTIGLDKLKDATDWFEDNEIPLYGIQTNPEQKSWTNSPKALAELYIDDCGLGCPLVYSQRERPYVDWIKVRVFLEDKGILSKRQRYNLFLDDERMPSDVYAFMMNDAAGEVFMEMEASNYIDNSRWVIVRTFHEFVLQIATHGLPSMVSFDHDLADFSGPNREERTGMDCANYMVNVLYDKSDEFPIYKVHSKNTVGGENILKYLENAEKHIK